MSEEPLFNRSRSTSYKNRLSTALIQWKGSVVVIVISFLIAISGFTILTFILMLQKEPPEKKGVEFPFDREIVAPLSYSEESGYENPRKIIENTARQHSLSDNFIEIVLQNEDVPLFITDILKNKKESLPENVRDRIEGFSIGSLEGKPFFLINFSDSAFPILSEHSKELFRSMSHFTGRASTEEIERMERANTLVVLRDGNIVYGYLEKNTVAITESEEVFLDILKRYRPI
ncbi:MAG: hypothetical protein ACQEP6_02435 [Patescibacteria group bacterium]